MDPDMDPSSLYYWYRNPPSYEERISVLMRSS